MKVPPIINNSGIYILEIYVSKPILILRFPDVIFKKGYYYYTGSAQANLAKRVDRHFRKNKKIHWHIDYITSHCDSTVTNSWLIIDKKKDFECVYNRKLLNTFNLTIPVKGFGNSDCSFCDSHLLYSLQPANIHLSL